MNLPLGREGSPGHHLAQQRRTITVKSLGSANYLLKFGIPLFIAVSLAPALAEAPTFEVTLALSESWTDNPAYVAGSTESEVINTLGVDIPYRRERPNYIWSFIYSPSYRRHSEFSDLDHFEHLLTTRLEGTPSAKTSYELDLTYLNTQSQDVSDQFVTQTDFLTNRTQRESITANVGVQREVAPRWRIKGNLRARTLMIDDISGFDSGVMPEQLGDQISTMIGTGASYQRSERTTIDFGYTLRGYDLDLSADETVNAVNVQANNIVSPKLTVSYGAGVASRSGAAGDDTTFEANGTLTRQVKRGSFSAGVDRSARNGDAVAGGSTVSAVALRYGESIGRRTQWSAAANWSLREPTDDAEEDVELLRGSLALTIRGPRFEQGRLKEGLGLRFKATAVDQSGAEDDEFNSSYYVFTAALLAFFSN